MDDVHLGDFKLQKLTVFKSDSDSIYRIPALFYERESETVLAFAERRTSPADSSTKMLVMKSGMWKKEEGSDVRTIEWSELKEVKEAHLDGHRPMNPCPVFEKTSKTLFLFFICVEGEVEEQWQINNFTNKARLCYITSTSLGQDWNNGVTDLTDTFGEIKNWATFAVGPGHGLQTKSGRLIVPTHACYFRSKSEKPAPYALPLYSDDSGKNWQLGKMLDNESIECQMAEFFDDKDNSFIYCNARINRGYRVEAVCRGNEETFSKLSRAEKLVETGRGCHGSVVSFPAQNEDAHADGDPSQNPNKWLLFTHPSNEAKRINLGVYLNTSPQNPNAWSKPWIINSGPSGYSDLAYTGDGWFTCLMECGKKKELEQIASVVFSYNEVKQSIGETEDVKPGLCDSCFGCCII